MKQLVQIDNVAMKQSSYKDFVSMPHQVMFSLGAIQAVMVMVWWLIDIAGRFGNFYAPIIWTIPPNWAHLYLMIFGLFPPYMFGFLMTTYPKWMSGKPVASEHYLPAALLLTVGTFLTYLGLIISKTLLIFSIVTFLLGWAMALYALLRVYVEAQKPDVLHARITTGVLIIGFSLLLVYLLGLIINSDYLIGIARNGGIWWFLFPVFIAVSHRLIPFFSSVVIPNYMVTRPSWALWVLVFGGIIHGVFGIVDLTKITWVVDFPMGAISLWLSYRWLTRKVFDIRILSMLHISFIWVGISLFLFGIQSLIFWVGNGIVIGKAPLHALLVGYFSSMLIAMATRVTLGHSGRPLVADQSAWLIYLTVQAAALVRVLADIIVAPMFAGHLYLCSALLWLLAFGCWLIKFSPIFWASSKE